MIGGWVEAVAGSGWKARRVVHGQWCCARGGRVTGVGRYPSQIRYISPYPMLVQRSSVKPHGTLPS